MRAVGKADVIVAVDRVTPLALRCLQRVVESGDPALGRLIVVTGPTLDPSLEDLSQRTPLINLVRRSDDSVDINAWNRGLLERTGDAVLLAAGSLVWGGWLTELSAVAHGEERTAFAWPLSNLCFSGSHLETDDRTCEGFDRGLARKAARGLPASTSAPVAIGPCVLLRGPCIDAIGLLDPCLGTLQSAVLDWVMRAQALGFFGKRSNHAYVEHSPAEAMAEGDGFQQAPDRAVLEKRHPHHHHQIAQFSSSLDGRFAKHVMDFVRTGKLRVAFDIRHIIPGDKGTRKYAIDLAKALALHPEVDLSLLVDDPVQAGGLAGRVITPREWRDEFAVFHRPDPFFTREELAIPFGSSAHVVIGNLFSNADSLPATADIDADHGDYHIIRALSLLCASGILAQSKSSQDLLAAVYGIPIGEIAVAHAGSIAQSTIQAYRRAVLEPAQRALEQRRNLSEAILRFSEPVSSESLSLNRDELRANDSAMGVRSAWKVLHAALGHRVRREVRRFHAGTFRKRA
jgi:hypothetical protein